MTPEEQREELLMISEAVADEALALAGRLYDLITTRLEPTGAMNMAALLALAWTAVQIITSPGPPPPAPIDLEAFFQEVFEKRMRSKREPEASLAWAKARALEYVDSGDLDQAVASMISDLRKHEETRSIGFGVFRDGFAAALSGNPEIVRRWIEGLQ